MKKIIFHALLLSLILASCTGKESEKSQAIIISGKIFNKENAVVSLQAWADTLNTTIPVELNPSTGDFSKTLNIQEPGYYRLFLSEGIFADLILFKNDIKVDVDQNNRITVSGSPEMDLISRIDSLRDSFDLSPGMVALNDDFSKAVDSKDEVAIEQVRERYQGLLKDFNNQIAAQLTDASPSIGVIQILSGNTLDREEYFSVYEQVAEKFTGEWLNYSLVREFTEKVKMLKLTAIGSEAPEINLPDPTGKFVKLSDFRGKYILVDFWAKWCGPCRRENPNLVKAYNKFKGENFEVIGVSLDRNKEDWMQAIAEDGLSWVHVSDLKYFNSVAARDYNINAIPFSLLIDPQGIIVAKNLRGEALHKTLEKYLKRGS